MSTELRLALAMRGGVSLAVWIGGAVSEIDLIRRASVQPGGRERPPGFWSDVLTGATDYDGVVVDVLAGASAGGLNGVLYAASQVYDFPFGVMRDIWLSVGSTKALVRRDPPWPSLFKGDEYFLTTVHSKLADLTGVGDGTRARRNDAPDDRVRVELALSATLMEPVARPLPSPQDEPLVERRHAGGFRFRQPEERWLPSDFARGSDPRLDDTLWRLALAARSTSSYPAAFEAAEVRSTRRATFTSPATDGAGTGPQVDLDGIFLDRTCDALPFVVADGGILDNIPIQTALDFVAHAPAGGPTERFLLYLQPGASTAPADAAPSPGGPGRRTTVAVARGVLAARVAGETINADIAAIEDYNEAIERAAALRHATFDGVADRSAFLAAASLAQPPYVVARASYEAKQAFALLLDPIGVLGGDPFPQAVAGVPVPDARWRSPIARWPQPDRQDFETALARRLEATLAATASPLTGTGDPGPLLRVTELLIEWARWVEHVAAQAADAATLAHAGDVKRSLYRVRSFLGEVLDRTRLLAWVAAAAVTGDEPASFVERIIEPLRALTRVTPTAASQTVDALKYGGQAPLEAARAGALGRIDDVVARTGPARDRANPPPADATVDLLDEIGPLLVELVAPLARASVEPDGPDDKVEPGQLLHRVLAGEPLTPAVLEGLEILCLPEFVSGLPGRRGIDFRRLSTANRTPIVQSFVKLLDDAQKEGLWWDPTVPREQQQGIHVTLKLAGNELANFSAFLLARWRANDWLWGRLDAVPTMVDLLVRPGPLATHLVAAGSPDAAVEAVAQLVAPRGHRLEALLTTSVLAPLRAAITGEVAALLVAAGDSTRDHLDALRITGIRNGVIARRQWEILDEERAMPDDANRTRPGAMAVTLEQWVAAYDVGAETLRGNRSAPELLDRFEEISNGATEAAIWNAARTGPQVRPLPPLVATVLRRAGPLAGRWVARRLVLAPSSRGGATWKAPVALAATALVVAGVLGWFVDRTAFLLGLAVSVLPLGALVVLLAQRVVRVLRAEAAKDEVPSPAPVQPVSPPPQPTSP